MRKLLHDFKNSNDESFYDLREDWHLIEASLAAQYGIRIRQHTDMPWEEFCTLVAGLMPETPLGSIVTIRSEKDRKVIKGFTSAQRKIYNDWRLRTANKQLENKEQLDKKMKNFEVVFAQMFGGDGNGRG
ncbi:bacteriophage Gp15 protein [Ruminiclostridium sufflavum DSM 19573]|uniref:Bacteriophage Gp15 protein n=1 Tax=Ruminiclostridium sufflavum DSM 19573 TaxID=1121337 RepID=A0A318XP84_9FIRM|nr:Gp15 family bacteriophage protein [Ruminiclostridium sufflavum]PYG90136.1 bacteriophage Gp15 protein [Ruminiclostridium sufflavum DSM 19573]